VAIYEPNLDKTNFTINSVIYDQANTIKYGQAIAFDKTVSGDGNQFLVIGSPDSTVGGTGGRGEVHVDVADVANGVNAYGAGAFADFTLLFTDTIVNDTPHTAGERLGSSVAMHEGVVVAGAPYNKVGGTTDTSGAAFVWVADSESNPGTSTTHWHEYACLTGTAGHWGTTAGADQNSALGVDVDIFKNTIVVGAPSGKYDGTIQGAALVYTGYNPNSVIDKPKHWNWATTLTASDGVGGDRFGSSVSMPNSSTIIIGSPRQVGVGLASVYVFTGAGSSWTQTQKITYSGASSSDVYGHYDNSLAATQKEIFVGGDEGTPENVIRYRI